MSEQDNMNEWIDRFTNDELEGEELERFLKALHEDRSVKKETLIDSQINEMLQDQDLFDFQQKMTSLRARMNRRCGLNCFLLAASLLLLISIGGMLIPYLHGTFQSLQNTFRSSVPSVPKDFRVLSAETNSTKGKWGIPISCFTDTNNHQRLIWMKILDTPIPFMESLVGESTRSGFFKLLTPGFQTSVSSGDSVIFSWDKNFSSPVLLEVINNQGRVIYQISQPGSDTLILQTDSLGTGLFYWKITQDNQWICVGKLWVSNNR